MPQNGRITELRGSPIRKKTSKNFKTLSELKDQVHSQKELPNKYSSWWNIFFVFVFKKCLQDILIKTNIFTLVISLQKTFSRRLQDVLIKTNIFVLVICLQDLFKTFSRHLQDVLKMFSNRLQEFLERCL